MTVSSTYHFLPWAREGLANRLRAPGPREDPRRGHVTVTATLNEESLGDIAVATLGPGDVTGLAPHQILRTDPPPDTLGFEPDHYPTLDLDSPTLPWLFTPLPPTGDRLPPWLCLVAVRQQPGVRLRTDGVRNTTVLEIRAPADARRELPDLTHSWAWAHVQLVGALATGESAAQVLRQAPERTVSRLICPTPLRPDARYHACLVPTFAIGRAAGLNLPLPEGTGPAWHATDQEVTLPVYHHWEFSTGTGHSFADLVRALRFRSAPEGVGRRPFDLAGSGLTAPTGAAPLPPFDGALVRLGSGHTAPPDWVRQALAPLVGTGSGSAAPLYGGEHLDRRTVSVGDTGWLAELNLDPRYRGVAGLAAAVVRERQEDLVAAAWQQAGDVGPVNRLLATSDVANTVNGSLHARRLTGLPADGLTLTQLAAPLGRTAGAAVVTTTAYRRVSRRRGPIARRVAAPAPVTVAPADVAALTRALEPARTVKQRVDSRLNGATGADQPDRIRVAPTFPTPMVGELARLAPQFLLPGADRIPPESVVALETNPRFVAAFLAGLTTELASELRWRDFPLAERATLFRHFWDQRGQGGDGTADVPPIDKWPADRRLDQVVTGDAARLVLAVRGELLRRHPRTAVYAVRAASRTAPADEAGTGNVAYPIFGGTLGADLRYFGFDLTEEQATGLTDPPGWFFVFAEQPTETRFGPPPTGDPLAGAGVTAAEVARRTLRLPLRVLIHAADLLTAD
ncbi:hypothetical protein VAB18032_21715 [Micromonospora maris AB-18-032]|uniref:Uncharacterized protein n=1 Tax=Micromonospora maris TaxID=1003110 RepID=A0A9X0I142_9ACTN|nr:hypothetical protein VAB18032_21715 [Micromonospora maris AB-18-032]KUJ44823.1 hypothetical protein ADL17_16915 [Micromonospora maris]